MSCCAGRHRFRTGLIRNLCLIVFLAAVCPATLLAQSPEGTESDPTLSAGLSGGSDDSAGAKATSSDLPDAPSSTASISESSSRTNLVPTAPAVAIHPLTPSGKFDLKAAFWQSFGENMFFHVWRVAFDPGMRWNVAHKPFFHDWFASYPGYDMTRWGDGDNFVVNDVGHPLEGAVFARTFLQNSPNSQVAIGKNSRYWTSRLKALAWSAAWSIQLEIGPISETIVWKSGWLHLRARLRHLSVLLEQPEVS